MYLQPQVRGDPVGLDGGDVGAGYFGHGVCIGEITKTMRSGHYVQAV